MALFCFVMLCFLFNFHSFFVFFSMHELSTMHSRTTKIYFLFSFASLFYYALLIADIFPTCALLYDNWHSHEKNDGKPKPQNGNYMIDPDGLGGLDPFEVHCVFPDITRFNVGMYSPVMMSDIFVVAECLYLCIYVLCIYLCMHVCIVYVFMYVCNLSSLW